jgi:hypothetical protein
MCVIASLQRTSGNRIMRYEIGEWLQQRARGVHHGYKLTAISDYTTKRGHASKVLTWLGSCACCGRPFTATSGRRPKCLARTCPDHRGKYRGGRGTPRPRHDAKPVVNRKKGEAA